MISSIADVNWYWYLLISSRKYFFGNRGGNLKLNPLLQTVLKTITFVKSDGGEVKLTDFLIKDDKLLKKI